mgnify:CR=1 FL=1
MRCTHCEKCCRETEMELCEADISRLERAGHRREDFCQAGPDGVSRLRNKDDFCVFYDHASKRCTEYARRPLGCVIYPVNMSAEGDVMIDELCPEADSVTQDEFESKGRQLCRLLDTITMESNRSKKLR